jgi:hypothetical protein
VGLLWRAEWDPVVPGGVVAENCRLHGVFAAFSDRGVRAEPIVYTDESADLVSEQLRALDGVLVWVNPIEHGRDRARLDMVLRVAADDGTWISAHPDVILRMATKQVLVDTASMSWSTETRLYRTAEELRERFPTRLADDRPLVLKRQRGMGGNGVWKVERDGPDHVVVQHAARGGARERLSLDEFLRRCEPYFATGIMVEQAFQRRLDEGMIRVYLCHDEVVGFAHQYPAGLLPPDAVRPGGKRFELASAPEFRTLRDRMQVEWIPELQAIVGVDRESLPVIWDADFLYGEQTPTGEDTYVLCEINASSTFAFPEHAMPTVARAALERVRASG